MTVLNVNLLLFAFFYFVNMPIYSFFVCNSDHHNIFCNQILLFDKSFFKPKFTSIQSYYISTQYDFDSFFMLLANRKLLMKANGLSWYTLRAFSPKIIAKIDCLVYYFINGDQLVFFCSVGHNDLINWWSYHL